MTGEQAWSIIAPILSAHMSNIPFTAGRLNSLDEAYVITFGALQRFDKWKKEDACHDPKDNAAERRTDES